MLLNGGREVGTVTGSNYFFWIVAVPDDKLASTIDIIRDLRIKGMKFDNVNDDETK